MANKKQKPVINKKEEKLLKELELVKSELAREQRDHRYTEGRKDELQEKVDKFEGRRNQDMVAM